jgi:hypothetical protein
LRPTILAAVAAAILIAGCSDPQAAGDALVRDLRQVYPGQITGIEFENHPPLDPPTLFIDLAPSMTSDQQLRFLCDEVMARVKATGSNIAVTSYPYGWNDDDCR